MAAPRPNDGQPRPEVGEVLVVVHDFLARSSDELSLAKGDRVELIERDDEFGDGWFLGKHMINGNSGLFPEVYTRPAPKSIPGVAAPAAQVLTTLPEAANETKQSILSSSGDDTLTSTSTASPAVSSTITDVTAPITLPLIPAPSKPDPVIPKSPPAAPSAGLGTMGRLNTSQDSQVLHETLNVINEHITDLRSPSSNGALHAATDSGSEYSAPLDQRLSYIQGEETDDEEDGMHTRAEVSLWTPDQVAEYLFTAGVEKPHCEVFRDQEISGEVLLGMDQSSLFIKAFDLGSVGRRLKTWQKIKALQDEVSGNVPTRRTTQTYGSEAGSEDHRRTRSRTSTITSSVLRMGTLTDNNRPTSIQARRMSYTQTPKMDPTPLVSPVSPNALDSPTRPAHIKRPSAASVRDLHHSRRHSSTDFRLTGTTVTSPVIPKLASAGTFPQGEGEHKKQPSFDRNWTMGGAYSTPRPLSSTGMHDVLQQSEADKPESSAVDLDRGYFSSTDGDGRRRNVLRKRDSTTAQSRKTSYADEQRVRSATATSRHSRYGSVESSRDSMGAPSAAQKYYGLQGTAAAHRRTASAATTESVRPSISTKDISSPVISRLESVRSTRGSPVSPISPGTARSGTFDSDWLASVVNKPTVKIGGGMRAISDTGTGGGGAGAGSYARLTTPSDSTSKGSPIPSPAHTGSSTPSGGPSFDLDSPATTNSPTTAAANAAAARGMPPAAAVKRKNKKETSAYQRGLMKVKPEEAAKEADFSGWMKKKSSNLMTTWKSRFFVLKGRRLAYYYSNNDQEEKGLIDISFHRVLPADNDKITELHATLTGARSASSGTGGQGLDKGDHTMFIFKLVPPRTGLSRAVNFTKPTVHYFAVPNLKLGRLWMAALMKATIDRDDAQPITTTYQQKTISLAKARAMRHRPPALMNLEEQQEAEKRRQEAGGLGISFGETDSGVGGLEKLGLHQAESANPRQTAFDSEKNGVIPQSA